MPFAIDPSLSLNENLSECVFQCHDLVKLACKYQVSYQHDLAYKHWMSLQSLTLQAFNAFHNQYSSEFLNDNLTQDELHLLNSLKSMKQEAGKRAHKCFEVIIASKMNSLPNSEKVNGKMNPSVSSLGSYSSSSTSRTSVTTESNHTKTTISASSATKLNGNIPAINTCIGNNSAKPQPLSPLVSSINDNQLKTWNILDINKSASLPGTQVTSPTMLKPPIGIVPDKVVEEQEKEQEHVDNHVLKEEQVKEQEKENENEQKNKHEDEKYKKGEQEQHHENEHEGEQKQKMQQKITENDINFLNNSSTSLKESQVINNIIETDTQNTVKMLSKNPLTVELGVERGEDKNKTNKTEEEEYDNDQVGELTKSAANLNFASGTLDLSTFSENNIIEYYNDDDGDDDDDDDDEGYESASETKIENNYFYSDDAESIKSDGRKSNGNTDKLTELKSSSNEKEPVNDILSGLLDDIQHHINGVSSNEDVANTHAEESSSKEEHVINTTETNEKKFTRDIMTYFNNSKDEIDLLFLNAGIEANNANLRTRKPSDAFENQTVARDIAEQERIDSSSDNDDNTRAEMYNEMIDDEKYNVKEYSACDSKETPQIDSGEEIWKTETQDNNHQTRGNTNIDGEESSYYAIQIQDFKKSNRNEFVQDPFSSTDTHPQRIYSETDHITHRSKEGTDNSNIPVKSLKFINSIRRFNSEEFGKVKLMVMVNKSSTEAYNYTNNSSSVENPVGEATKQSATTSNTNINFRTKFAKVFKK